MDWSAVSPSFLTMAGLCCCVQMVWITTLVRRNRRQRRAAPLSQREFRRDLDRILGPDI